MNDDSSYSGNLGKRSSDESSSSIDQLRGEAYEDSKEVGVPGSVDKRERRYEYLLSNHDLIDYYRTGNPLRNAA